MPLKNIAPLDVFLELCINRGGPPYRLILIKAPESTTTCNNPSHPPSRLTSHIAKQIPWRRDGLGDLPPPLEEGRGGLSSWDKSHTTSSAMRRGFHL